MTIESIIDLLKDQRINLDIKCDNHSIPGYTTQHILLNNKSITITRDSVQVINQYSDFTYFFGIDNVKQYCSLNSKKELFLLSSSIYKRTLKFTRTFNYIGFKIDDIIQLDTFNKVLLERMDEFEVIKDNKLDLISLNSLFDYYNQDFKLKVWSEFL